MAADKTHLKTKLIPTDQKTDAGRIIYKNAKTGELHSELSITFQYPKGTGLWINVPSIHNGKLYNQKQIMKMLKNGDIQPTSNHTSEAEAIEEAIFRSNNLQHVPATPEDYVGANIKQKDVVSIDAEVPVADTKIQSSGGVNIKNKAKLMAAASQSRKLAGILDQVDAEHADDYYKVYPNALQTTRPDKILNKATQYLDQGGQANLDAANAQRAAERESAIGRSMESYGPRTGPEVPKPGSRAGSSAELSMGVNPDKHHVSRDRYNDMAVNEAENAFQGMDNNRTWGQTFMDAMGNIAGVAGMNYTGDQARADAAVNAAENAFQNQGTGFPGKRGDIAGSATHLTGQVNEDHPAYQAQLEREAEKAQQIASQQAMQDKQTFQRNQLRRAEADFKPYLGKSWESPVTGPHMGEEVIKATTPDKKSKFEYKPHMTPEQKMNAGKDLKGLTPNYGEMPGFKRPLDAKGNKQGYFDVDEKSGFWKTDAGYEKAVQTWGRDGGPLPHFVRKPKRKELDVDKILKIFS